MFDFLESGIELDASGYQAGANEAIAASHDVADATEETSESLFDLDPAGVAAGGAIAGVGTAMQSVLDDSQALRESLGRTSASTELTQDEANGLARSMSDATFPIEDATATMDQLAQQGITTAGEMEEVATAADNIADATDSTAESIASSAGPALNAMGGDVSDLSEHMDTFTFVARTSTMSVEDFSQTVRKVGPEIEEMGLSVDQTAAILTALEEKGLDSRTAMREFRQAANDAEGDQQKLIDSLGLSQEALDEQTQALANAEGMTVDHANAANESLSTMDSLRAGFDDAKLAIGGYLGPVSAAAPALQGLGVAAIAMSTINFGALAPSFAAVSAASLPVTGPILAIGGALAALGGAVAALAWKSDWIDPMETAGWAAERAGEGIAWLRGRMGDAIDMVMKFYPPIVLAREVWERNLFGIQDTTATVVDAVGGAIDWLVEKVNTIPGVNIGGDDVEVDEDEVEDAGEETGKAFAAGRDQGLEGTGSGAAAGVPDDPTAGDQMGTPQPPGAEEPSIETPESSPTSTSAGSATARGSEMELSRESIRDLGEELEERFDGALLEVLLQINERELRDLVRDEVNAELTT